MTGSYSRLNRVSENIYLGAETQASGILLLEAGKGSEVALNRTDACDTCIALSDTDGVLLTANRVSESARYGFVIRGAANTLLGNLVDDTTGVGIYVEGEDNSLARNHVLRSSELDIYNVGANDYERNRCATSSGAPVDCPH